MDPVLEARDLVVERGGKRVLDGASMTVEPDTERVIVGESGAGKTTLFYVLGLLDVPTSGDVVVDGTNASTLPERKRARLRRDHIGFVFQDFQLIPDLTAWENARLPQEHAGQHDEAWLAEVFDLLEIASNRGQYPAELSGGEKQRVAIARALANRPAVVLADEPTGQLDPGTAMTVLSLLRSVRAETGTSLVAISHDRTLVRKFDKRTLLRHGRLDRSLTNWATVLDRAWEQATRLPDR